ncbi:MAG TPA: D-2-hydroxyacid dehydrogenase family protein [Thermomicrobiales bacterium]|nr:D-2-hydroxyacid dehydrogenase family protein [Thermomicrobiales bacterium]
MAQGDAAPAARAGRGRPLIVVPDDYDDVYGASPAFAALRERADVAIYTTPHDSLDDLVARLRDAEVVVANRERIPLRAEIFDRLPALRLVAQTGSRGAHLDLAAAEARGIVVAGTVGTASATSTAELTIGLMLAALRRIPAGDAGVRAGGWPRTVGREASGLRLGIVGLGRIGGRVARVAGALGMEVLAWSPSLTSERAGAAGALARPLDDLLREADVVTLHLRLAPETRGLLDRDTLALLKPSALVVNTARGALLDEAALVEMLQAGRLWGAALDVFAQEPLPTGHPLRALPNVVLSPHVGWIAERAYAEFIAGVVETIVAYLDGRPVPYPLTS